jgi:hypothetical protein
MGRPLEGQQKIQRYKIGTGSLSNLKVKQTSPGVMTVQTSDPSPSRPQNKERMSVGGSKARQRPKGRTDPMSADPKDPGAYPMPNTTVNWPTNDKNAKKGYVVGRGWPNKTAKGGASDTLQEGIGAEGPY